MCFEPEAAFEPRTAGWMEGADKSTELWICTENVSLSFPISVTR